MFQAVTREPWAQSRAWEERHHQPQPWVTSKECPFFFFEKFFNMHHVGCRAFSSWRYGTSNALTDSTEISPPNWTFSGHSGLATFIAKVTPIRHENRARTWELLTLLHIRGKANLQMDLFNGWNIQECPLLLINSSIFTATSDVPSLAGTMELLTLLQIWGKTHHPTDLLVGILKCPLSLRK